MIQLTDAEIVIIGGGAVGCGVAYSLTPRTVIRSAYGVGYIHFNRLGGENLLSFNGPHVVPIAISLAAAAGMDPVVPALAAIFGSSFGFMLPVSTPPNAIVYGSGRIPITRMIRAGLVFDVVGAIIIAVGVTAMAEVAGLA